MKEIWTLSSAEITTTFIEQVPLKMKAYVLNLGVALLKKFLHIFVIHYKNGFSEDLYKPADENSVIQAESAIN